MRRGDRGLFAVVLVLALGALGYGGAYLARAVLSDVKSYTVRAAVLRDTVPLRGVVIREECVLYADSPFVRLAVTEGERVGRGALLGLSCPREGALPAAETALALRRAQTLLRPLRPGAGRGDDEALESAAALLTRESAAALARGQLPCAAAYLSPLGAFLRGEEGRVSALSENADYSPVLSPQSGLFSETTDSLESLSPETPGTADELRRLTERRVSETVPGALGRLCTGSAWYLAAPVPAESLGRFSPGDTVTLRLDALTVRARVSSVTPGEDEGVVLFSAREGLSDILSVRYTGGEAVLSEQSGLLVSEDAVFSEGEGFFVYRAAGRVVKRTEVSVLARSDGEVLLSAPLLRPGSVLLSGRGLSDGMPFSAGG